MEFLQYLASNDVINETQIRELEKDENLKVGDILIAKKILPRKQVLQQLKTFVKVIS